jgi:hypothetical protein
MSYTFIPDPPTYNNLSDLTDIVENNENAMLEILYGTNFRAGVCKTSSYYDNSTNTNVKTYTYADYTLPTSTSNIVDMSLADAMGAPTDPNTYAPTFCNYLPTKLLGGYYEYNKNNGELFIIGETNRDQRIQYMSDNVRLPHRLAKLIYKFTSVATDTRITQLTEVLRSVTDTLFTIYLLADSNNGKNRISNTVYIYQQSYNVFNDSTSVMPMVAAIDALAYRGITINSYSAANDPRTYYRPTTTSTVFSLSSFLNLGGNISYYDIYKFTNFTQATEASVFNTAYPFFNTSTGGAQQLGLGIINFLMTNEGLDSDYNIILDYFVIEAPGTSLYANLSVTNPVHGAINIVDDIIYSYWMFAFVGEFFGGNSTVSPPTRVTSSDTTPVGDNSYYGVDSTYQPYLISMIIDGVNNQPGVNYIDTSGYWSPLSTAPSQYEITTKLNPLFEIWACADNGWASPDGTGSRVAPGKTLYHYDSTPNWTSIASSVLNTDSAHNLQIGFVLIFGNNSNGLAVTNLYSTPPELNYYYVVGVPTPTSITVSTTLNGTAATLTDGTNLSITCQAKNFIYTNPNDFYQLVVSSGSTPNWTSIASSVISTGTAHNLQIGFVLMFGDHSNGLAVTNLYSEPKVLNYYYVVGVPTPTSITVSTTLNGTAATLINGTNLSITGNFININPLPMNNFMGPTVEIFSYQLLVAAMCGDFQKFCALHRYYYYMLYLQNGSPDGDGGVMGDANTETFDNGTPPGASTVDTASSPSYANRARWQTAGGATIDNKPAPWPYVSYCMGYQPYANFMTKLNISSKTPGEIDGPIYYMANPYWKLPSGLYSASDGDYTVCFAYKLAALAAARTGSTFGSYDTEVANMNLSSTVKNKVGASSTITWDYMYQQVRNTMLAISGHQYNTDSGTTKCVASNFYDGVIATNLKLITQGHDTGSSTTLHPDYMDFSIMRDWLDEVDNNACFLEGTKILTTRGYVPVEALQRGDQVVSCGDLHDNRYCERKDQVVPIRWVGKYTKLKPIRKHQPICITKDTFCMGMPFEDVYLSGNHGVVLLGKLVTARRLLNDSTVYRVPVDKAVYYHIEVDGHQCILANGVRAETYLDTGKRKAFHTVFSD